MWNPASGSLKQFHTFPINPFRDKSDYVNVILLNFSPDLQRLHWLRLCYSRDRAYLRTNSGPRGTGCGRWTEGQHRFTHQTPVPRPHTHPYQHIPFLKGYKFWGVHMAVVVIIVFRFFRFASTYTQWMVSTFCVKTTIKWPKGLWEVIRITSTFVWCHTNVTSKTNKTNSVPQSYFIYSDVHVKIHLISFIYWSKLSQIYS